MICQKSWLILWKLEIMRELRRATAKPGAFSYHYMPYIKVLRKLNAFYRRNVIVDPDIHKGHKMKAVQQVILIMP